MSGLGGLNKSTHGVVVGLVQLQLPVVETPAQLAAQTQLASPPMTLAESAKFFEAETARYRAIAKQIDLQPQHLGKTELVDIPGDGGIVVAYQQCDAGEVLCHEWLR